MYDLQAVWEFKKYFIQNIFRSSAVMQMSLYLLFFFLQKGSPSEFIRERINSLEKLPSALPTHSLVNHYTEVIYEVKSNSFCGRQKSQVTGGSFDRNKDGGEAFSRQRDGPQGYDSLH